MTDIADLTIKIDTAESVRNTQALKVAMLEAEHGADSWQAKQARVIGQHKVMAAESNNVSAVTSVQTKEMQKLDAEVARYLGTQDKTAKAMLEYSRAESLMLNARKAGVINTEQQAQMMAYAAAAYEKATGAAVSSNNALGMSSKETAQRVGTLTAALARGETGEFTQSVSSLIVRLGVMNPLLIGTGVGLVALGGYFAYAEVRSEQFNREIAKLQAMMAGTGRAAIFSNEDFNVMIQTLERMPGIARESAIKIVSSFSKENSIGAGMFKELVDMVPSFAAAIGEDMPQAAAKLAKSFGDPQAGVMALDKELNFLTLSQVKQIEKMKELGDSAGIAKIGLKALEERIQGLQTAGLTPLQLALNELSRSWKGAMGDLAETSKLSEKISLFAQGINTIRNFGEEFKKLVVIQAAEKNGVTFNDEWQKRYGNKNAQSTTVKTDAQLAVEAAKWESEQIAAIDAERLEKQRVEKEKWLVYGKKEAEKQAAELKRIAEERFKEQVKEMENDEKLKKAREEKDAKELTRLLATDAASWAAYYAAKEEQYIADGQAANKARLKSIADQEKIIKTLDDYLDPAKAKNFGDALSESFGEAASAISKLISSMEKYGQKESEIAKMRKEAEKITDPAKRIQVEMDLDKKATKEKLSGYADMADAASGFFDKQSRGYQALQAVSQVFHAAELAMTIAELVPKAMAAVLNQGNGDPYTAFGRMAAMAALVAGIGVAVGGGGGGGGSAPNAEQIQDAAGTGSVLGDSKAKSESLANALELMSNNSVIGNEYMRDMARSLRSIEQNIGGLANIVARNSGLTGDTAGLSLGSKGNSLFGKTTRTLSDSGIQLDSQTVGQALGGVSAQGYADITTSKSSWFGLSKSSSTSRQTSGLSSEIISQFTSIVGGLFNSILEVAKIFGSDVNGISEVLKAFKIDFQSISFKDMTGKEIEDQLRSIFSKIGDDMAGAAFDGLQEFQKVGEGMFETLMRLGQEFIATNAIMTLLGKDVSTAFGSIGFASMKARTHLVELFGGIEDMSDAISKYYEDFYSESEKFTFSLKSVSDQFAMVGIDAPASISAFRKLVEAQDLSTEAGREMFASLMKIAPAFASVQNAISSMIDGIQSDITSIYGGTWGAQFAKVALDSAIDAVNAYAGNGTTREQTMIDLASGINTQYIIDTINNPATNPQVISLLSNMLSAYRNYQQAMSTGTTQVSNSTPVINSFTDALRGARDNLKKYMESLSISNLSPLSPQQKLDEAQRQYQKMLSDARTGSGQTQVNAINGLSGSANTYLTLAQQMYASSSLYNEIFRTVYEGLGTVATPGASSWQELFQTALPVGSPMASQADIRSLEDAISELITQISNGISTNDEGGTQAIKDVKLAVDKLAQKNGILSGT